MKLGETMVDALFIERPNRYIAYVELDGKRVAAHVPDPGRLPGLMIPKRRVRLIYQPGPKRKTDYSLVLVRHGSIWVSVFPSFANNLVGDALDRKNLEGFKGYDSFSREVKEGNSRFDFKLIFPQGPLFLEVKSVSFVENSVGKFPDAPTERGRKHLRELIHLKQKGCQSSVAFISQRSDTRTITSNDEVDPEFGKVLREAASNGVELYGYNCRVTPSSVSINKRIPVEL